ncbi:MAG TPA: aminodeoxychorismate/anthranilate synthase component II [Catalimonadaceae bacterium]|nr:aminodeoxychorismate/anthranilate synthase component II [Catalimonadaceae bacterium]
MKKVLVIDNYDSFTYNLVYIVRQLGYDPVVWRNDQFELGDVLPFDKIILSPGPGIPSEAGKMPSLIKEYAASHSILGVCLGHQAIGEAFGGRLVNLKNVFHGVSTQLKIDNQDGIFRDVPSGIQVGRYHSWVVSNDDFPQELEISATDGLGQIMALRHRNFDLTGVQFHPESIMTEYGTEMIRNWLES